MLQQRIGIEPEAVRMDETRDDRIATGAERREKGAHPRLVRILQSAGKGRHRLAERRQRRSHLLGGDEQGRRAPGQRAAFGCEKVVAAVGGEPAHQRVADAVMGEGGASAGAVMADRLLGLQHDHPAMGGKGGAGRKARDTPADDQKVSTLHGARG